MNNRLEPSIRLSQPYVFNLVQTLNFRNRFEPRLFICIVDSWWSTYKCPKIILFFNILFNTNTTITIGILFPFITSHSFNYITPTNLKNRIRTLRIDIQHFLSRFSTALFVENYRLVLFSQQTRCFVQLLYIIRLNLILTLDLIFIIGTKIQRHFIQIKLIHLYLFQLHHIFLHIVDNVGHLYKLTINFFYLVQIVGRFQTI